MGPGGFCGLQNRLRRLNCRWVGSIPTRSRHMNDEASEVFTSEAFFCIFLLYSVSVIFDVNRFLIYAITSYISTQKMNALIFDA